MLKTYFFIFGVIILGAGIQGALAGSMISLIAAAILGGLVLAGGYLLGSNMTLALVLALIGALGIAGRFLPAFLKAPDKAVAIWPAGILATLAVVSLVLTILAFVRR
jgi:Transmembrane proteins 14C